MGSSHSAIPGNTVPLPSRGQIRSSKISDSPYFFLSFPTLSFSNPSPSFFGTTPHLFLRYQSIFPADTVCSTVHLFECVSYTVRIEPALPHPINSGRDLLHQLALTRFLKRQKPDLARKVLVCRGSNSHFCPHFAVGALAILRNCGSIPSSRESRQSHKRLGWYTCTGSLEDDQSTWYTMG